MSRSGLRLALACSLLVNLGVVAAVGYHAAGLGELPLFGRAEHSADLRTQLGLTAQQRQQWNATEKAFLADLDADHVLIRAHRERLIGRIFSESPERSAIESERQAIASLQEKQQRRVIEQLLAEREILDTEQRQALAELLLRDAPIGVVGIEQLHRK